MLSYSDWRSAHRLRRDVVSRTSIPVADTKYMIAVNTVVKPRLERVKYIKSIKAAITFATARITQNMDRSFAVEYMVIHLSGLDYEAIISVLLGFVNINVKI